MRVLIVHSGNHEQVAPFIVEQVEALREAGCEVQMFAVEGHGIRGYLHCLPMLKKAITEYQPDIVHAHYGLCGLLCTLQHKVPVVITYHGSDINNRTARLFSQLAMHRSAHNIFVSKNLLQKVNSIFQFSAVARELDERIFNFDSLQLNNFQRCSQPSTQFSILPCGIDTRIFHPMPREEALTMLDHSHSNTFTHSRTKAFKLVLFAGAFDNEVKNPQLAKETCALMPEVALLELKGYSRTEVAALMNVADALLMTSHSEGSPQVVKEALACGLPVVSVDVGDVAEITTGVANCHIVEERSPQKLADAIDAAIKTSQRVRTNISHLDNRIIAKKIIYIYQTI